MTSENTAPVSERGEHQWLIDWLRHHQERSLSMTSENTAPVSERGEHQWLIDWLRQRDKSARTKDDPHATPYSRAASLIERLLSASPAPPPPSDVVLEQFRANGWMVAVHNDYRLNGERFTFWLLTKGDRCVKGEGRTDAEALAKARQIAALQGSEGGHAGKLESAPTGGASHLLGGERARLVCPECGGDGCFDREPYPTPNGPHYPEPQVCRRCDGSGEVPAEDGGDYTWDDVS